MFDNFDLVSAVLGTTTETAAEMTHALCELGGGSMGQGICEMFASGLQIGFTLGNMRGIIKGAATATAVISVGSLVVGGGVMLSKKLKERKAKELTAQTEKAMIQGTC